jgi:hypothetical protein
LRLAKNARKKFGYGTRKVPKIKLWLQKVLYTIY